MKYVKYINLYIEFISSLLIHLNLKSMMYYEFVFRYGFSIHHKNTLKHQKNQ
jgi:hypothetical protein